MNPGAIVALVLLGGGATVYFVGRGAAKKRGYATSQLAATIYGVPFRPKSTQFTFPVSGDITHTLRPGKVTYAGGGGGFEPKPK